MSKFKDNFVYEFEGELSYIKNGEPQKATFLNIKAPTNKDINEVMIIEQEYQKAELGVLSMLTNSIGKDSVNNLIENRGQYEEKSENKDINRESILTQMLSGNADMIKCIDSLKKILLKGSHKSPVAIIDDTEKLTNLIYEDMSPHDTKNLLAEYILNFIVTSQAP